MTLRTYIHHTSSTSMHQHLPSTISTSMPSSNVIANFLFFRRRNESRTSTNSHFGNCEHCANDVMIDSSLAFITLLKQKIVITK